VNPAPPSNGWRLRECESLPSTSDLCATLAQAGEPERLAILAARQTAGRGSRGRTWETLAGNLALSVLLRPHDPPEAAGHWALLAALALAEAIEAAGSPPLRLKWPNDVMLDGRKLAGILLDSAVEAGRLDWLVIGFGANLAAAPDLPIATSLPSPAPPRVVATALLDRLDHWRRLTRGENFAPVRQAWLARGPALGTHLGLRLGSGDVAGSFAGLSDQGALLLQSGGRVRAFSTGHVLQGA
jgi:BirA family biotin operon repressor/biotin-[acetyl-CoA-carboxylase] ligase